MEHQVSFGISLFTLIFGETHSNSIVSDTFHLELYALEYECLESIYLFILYYIIYV